MHILDTRRKAGKATGRKAPTHEHTGGCCAIQLQNLGQQSPINLKDTVYVQSQSESLDIGWQDNPKLKVSPKVDSHGGRSVEVSAGNSVALDDKSFELKQFHFHTPSEHLVAGSDYPMELHLVHQNPDDGTRTVGGVFIDDKGTEESDQNKQMKKMLGDFDKAVHDGSEFQMEPDALLPDDRKSFYRYEGSLTTPGFDENVSWIVMKEPIHLAPDTLSELSEKFGHSAREVQPLNRRFVLSTFQE